MDFSKSGCTQQLLFAHVVNTILRMIERERADLTRRAGRRVHMDARNRDELRMTARRVPGPAMRAPQLHAAPIVATDEPPTGALRC